MVVEWFFNSDFRNIIIETKLPNTPMYYIVTFDIKIALYSYLQDEAITLQVTSC
jgi:hypothetical protein